MNRDRLSKLRGRLKGWGAWRRAGVKGLGYPSMTPEARLYTCPGRGTMTNIAPKYEPDRDAMLLDDAIHGLPSEQQLVLWFGYVQESDTKICRKFFRLESRHEWYRMLEEAEKELFRIL